MKNEKIVVASKTAHSRRLRLFRASAALMLTTLMLVVAASTGATGQTTFKSLVSFDRTDGADPMAGLVQATNGNLYGTTESGGTSGLGTVFKITPSGTLTTLHSFDGTDGSAPYAGLIQATDGNLYGTTSGGGANGSCEFLGSTVGCGTVFKISPGGTLMTLYSFCSKSGCTDGATPLAGLVQATNGDLYGTTYYGGADDSCSYEGAIGCGTVFRITLGGTLTTIYNFTYGFGPLGLTQATNGNFYGTTTNGGANDDCTDGCGTIFRITPAGELATLYSFCSQPNCTDGWVPAGLVQASNGNFYGTTEYGGVNGYGTVFKITPSGTLTTLHSFDGTDGSAPYAGLIQATDGNLYGTTYYGGVNGYGTVFKITPSGTLTTLYSFCSKSNCTDGSNSYAGLVQDTNGTFYGTTQAGGASSYGTVFSLSVGLDPFVETVVPSGTGIQATSGKEGAKIGIMGQGFSSASVVKFGGTQATTVTLSGATYLTATVPPDALTGSVKVTTGTTTLTSTKTFDVLPTITSFTPESGPVGTSVTIKGTGLKQTTKLTFNGKSGTFTVISDTEVKADVPTDATTGKIAVTTKGGSATSATSFTVN
jgi:uncharacterized repeat protein (TIGR03803 family)